jgi:hypothetical protein
MPPNFQLQTNERIHEHTIPSGTTYPLAGPTTLFATTTSSYFEKPHSTPSCDEYPTRDKLYPTTNWGNIKTQVPINPKIQSIVVSSISMKKRLFSKHANFNTTCLQTLPQPPQKQIPIYLYNIMYMLG